MKQLPALFLSSAHENGRTADLAQAIGIPAHFTATSRRLPALMRYCLDAAKAIAILAKYRPKCVVVMQPPFPLLAVCWLYATVTRSRMAGDLHSGVFYDPKWKWSTRSTLRLLRQHLAIVTNEPLAERCRSGGVRRVLVLHDILLGSETAGLGNGTVLVPFSFANDEPILAMMSAARMMPSVTFKVTGDSSRFKTLRAPSNVHLTGFVSAVEYAELCRTASVFVALTTRPDTMQRAGYEAMAYGKPLVVSDTQVLSEFFLTAARYTDNSPESIASAIGDALSLQTACSAVMVKRRAQLQSEQARAVDVAKAYILAGRTS